MDPNDIELEDLSKSFEYMKASMEIDSIDEVDHLRNIAKSYIKLYLKHQEVVKNLMSINS
mgnify:CR=1 FL=1